MKLNIYYLFLFAGVLVASFFPGPFKKSRLQTVWLLYPRISESLCNQRIYTACRFYHTECQRPPRPFLYEWSGD